MVLECGLMLALHNGVIAPREPMLAMVFQPWVILCTTAASYCHMLGLLSACISPSLNFKLLRMPHWNLMQPEQWMEQTNWLVPFLPLLSADNGIGNMGPGVAAFPDTASVMSFNSAHTSSTQAHASRPSNHQLGTKVRSTSWLSSVTENNVWYWLRILTHSRLESLEGQFQICFYSSRKLVDMIKVMLNCFV